MKNQKLSTENKIIISIAGILCIGILIFAIINPVDGGIKNQSEPSKYDDFAQCITDAGAILYTSEGCSYCLSQKNLLGNSIKFIKEVECTINPNMCIDAGISGVPTWIIGDEKVEGFDKNKTMQELSDATGCPLP